MAIAAIQPMPKLGILHCLVHHHFHFLIIHLLYSNSIPSFKISKNYFKMMSVPTVVQHNFFYLTKGIACYITKSATSNDPLAYQPIYSRFRR